MNHNSFSIKEIVKVAWEVTRDNWLLLFTYTAATTLVCGACVWFFGIPFAAFNKLPSIINTTTPDVTSTEAFGFWILIIVGAYVGLTLYKLIFMMIDHSNYKFEYIHLMPNIRTLFSVITARLLEVSFLAGGKFIMEQPFVKNSMILNNILPILFLCFIVRCFFYICFIVDNDTGAIESLYQSFQLTRDHLFNILLIIFIGIACLFIGLLTFVIGVFIAYPFTNLLFALSYRRLLYDSHAEHSNDANTS